MQKQQPGMGWATLPILSETQMRHGSMHDLQNQPEDLKVFWAFVFLLLPAVAGGVWLWTNVVTYGWLKLRFDKIRFENKEQIFDIEII